MEDLELMMKVDSSSKHFYAIGISYKTADLVTRGKFSLSNEQCNGLLQEAKALGIEEILINTTCNRTEIYAYTAQPNELIELLCRHSGGERTVFDALGYQLDNEAAIHHVFCVRTGLDSQILGDFEII